MPALRSVLRFSQPLDVLLRDRACRLIPSRNHVQGHSRSGGFSPRAATCSSSDGVPPPLVQTQLTDLRRLPLGPVLDFEAFIHARPRSPWLRYSQRHAPLPSSGSSPPGPHFQQLIAVTCDAPLTTSAPCTFAFAIAPGARPQRVSRRKPDGHVSVPPACSSFRAVSPNPPCNSTSVPSARLPA